ncbi:MAG: Bug family tripartite tricarboxylate transporter substrate binding protein [Polynucleobacter sp.]|jgi:tripartite-type tricarboxylate transporter receptor subunit TctC|nr:tripartite tricarboxylate transporter substrate binding protein [Polynucleobacter sp.]MBU6322509.1 tripartite tricarboxylate transporter substrate binding protein [Burkholderiales bacterium]NBO86028.1 tripartite tricarboxylate transporter substrate binding protein [Burkholderiaceae bacterium]NBP18617.1 tripartite tricarboxylate transporter substrate binding protein [Burkholderiaceae bacterium]NCA09142.1 tripartite tricarboxylate transporter substrate binding protein [Burkholderiaceae bacteri
MRFLRNGFFVLISLLSLMTQSVANPTFPNKPIKIIIGFPAGGPLDAHIRLLTDRLQTTLGQSVIIDYKAGAGGTVGAQFVAQAPADGYTLLLANTGTMVINPAIYNQLPYDTLKDFQPIARTAQQPLALIVNNEVPAQSLREFIDYIRRNPGKVNYGSAGNGGISHLVPEMLKQETKTFMVHIPYRGSAPAFMDLMAGQVQFMAESIPQAANYAKQGKLRALAVTSSKRNSALPDVPTVNETGVAKLEVVGFYGVLAPKNTPHDVVLKLSNAFKQTLESKEIQQKMISQGADPAFLNAEDFSAFLKKEMPKWAVVVKQAGAKID